jgi:hypothetical protein
MLGVKAKSFLLNAIMLSVLMLSIVAPFEVGCVILREVINF